MDNEKLKKGILKILFANILNLIFSLGTNFLLPKYVSIDTYAQIKTYQLLASYIVILQLGYSDGMYLAFGGKDLTSINRYELKQSIETMRLFQIIVFAVSLCFALLSRDPVIIIAALTILPQNIVSYYKTLYQATGVFSKYSKVMNYVTGATFAVNVILMFIFKADNYLLYIIGYLGISIAICLILEYRTCKDLDISVSVKNFSIKELKEKVASGILLLFANFSSILLTSMDRWFIKFLMGSMEFAMYSFAVSLENFLNVAVSPITVTLYNYFCNNDSKESVRRVTEFVIVFASLLIACAFPIKFIIEIYLDKYLESVGIVFYLFCAQLFLIVIRSVYSNLYKAKKMQKKYFYKMCVTIVAAFILNSVCYFAFRTKESFALATLFSSIFWLVLSTMDFKQYKLGVRNIIYISVCAVSFMGCGLFLGSISGCILYVLICSVLVAFLMSNTKKYIITSITKKS